MENYNIPPATAVDISLIKRRSPSSSEARYLIKVSRFCRGMLSKVRKASCRTGPEPPSPCPGWRVSRWLTFPCCALYKQKGQLVHPFFLSRYCENLLHYI